MFPSCTRTTASFGFRSASDFIAAARDSSSGCGVCGCGPAADDPLVDGAAGAGGAPPPPCWLPMIHPTSRPKNTPAMPTAIASLDTVNNYSGPVNQAPNRQSLIPDPRSLIESFILDLQSSIERTTLGLDSRYPIDDFRLTLGSRLRD